MESAHLPNQAGNRGQSIERFTHAALTGEAPEQAQGRHHGHRRQIADNPGMPRLL